MKPQCSVCERPVRSQRTWFCCQCERDWDINSSVAAEWPDWIRYLRSQERKRRYDEVQRDKWEERDGSD